MIEVHDHWGLQNFTKVQFWIKNREYATAGTSQDDVWRKEKSLSILKLENTILYRPPWTTYELADTDRMMFRKKPHGNESPGPSGFTGQKELGSFVQFDCADHNSERNSQRTYITAYNYNVDSNIHYIIHSGRENDKKLRSLRTKAAVGWVCKGLAWGHS